jgi:hypothetical protein
MAILRGARVNQSILSNAEGETLQHRAAIDAKEDTFVDHQGADYYDHAGLSFGLANERTPCSHFFSKLRAGRSRLASR